MAARVRGVAVSAPIGVFGRLCPHCGTVAPPGLSAHHECALEATRAQVAARIEGDLARERREERARLEAAALRERARIVELLRAKARALREEGARCTLAATLQALAQRAAALDEAAMLIEGEER